MRVTLTTPTYWPETRRGTERVVHDLATGLAASRHDVRIITAHRRAPSLATEEGVRVSRHWRPPHRLVHRFGFPPHSTHVPSTAAELRLRAPDVAQTFYPTDGAAAAAWSARRGRPAVFSVMGVPRREAVRSTPRTWQAWRRAAQGAGAVVALSAVARAACGDELGVDARVIPPGVDLEAFTPGGTRSEDPTVLCAGAAEDPRKRIPLLVEAFAHVRRVHPRARLLVLRPHDPALAARLTADAPWVELFDLAPDASDLPGRYRSAWVSALASEKEAFGLVLVEALACGTPVVGGADGATPEILGDRPIGAAFGEPTPQAVAGALLEALALAGEPGTAAACRERAEDFSVARCVEAYAALYRELVPGR